MNNIFSRALTIILVVFFTNYGFSQGIVLKGNIINASGKPLPQVSISTDGDLGSAVTDSKGQFILPLSPNVKSGQQVMLRASKKGYVNQDELVSDQSAILIRMDKIPPSMTNSSPSAILSLPAFSTLEIKNQEFIFTNKPWPFITDKRGEDYNSEHTAPEVRKNLATLNPYSSIYQTIPNSKLQLKYSIRNKKPTDIYIDKIFLIVTDVYDIDEKSMFFNAWLPKMESHKLKVELTENKKEYDMDLEDVIGVSNKSPEFFTVVVNGDNTCLNHIFKFKIYTSYLDHDGKRYQIPSDRSYHIAFIANHLKETQVEKKPKTRTEEAGPIDTVKITGENKGAGKPIMDKASERFEESFLETIKADPAKVQDFFADTLIIGPSLWGKLKLSGINTDNIQKFTLQGTNVEGGMLQKRDEVKTFFTSDYFKYIISKQSMGGLRPATQNERGLFYTMIYFEILGKPVNIFDYGDSRLLIYFEKGKMKWMDIFDYYTKEDVSSWALHTIYNLGKKDSVTISQISRQPVSESPESPVKRKNYELDYSLFLENLYIASEDNSFTHLQLFVRDNPDNCLKFIVQALEYDGGRPIESGSLTWELLCKMGILYKNFYYENTIIDFLKKFDAYSNGGGRYLLNKMLYLHDNLHGEPDKANLEAIKISMRISPYESLKDSISLSLPLLKNGKSEAAYNNYKKYVSKFISLRSPYFAYALTEDKKKVMFPTSLELNLFLYIILLKQHNEHDLGDAVLAYCYSLKMHFASMFMACPFSYVSPATLLKAAADLPAIYPIKYQSRNAALESLIDKITCKDFSNLIDQYTGLSNLVFERQPANYSKIMKMSTGLLSGIDKYNNPVLDIQYIKNELFHIRALQLSYHNEKVLARKELLKVKSKFSGEQEKQLQDRILNMPEKYMMINEITYRESYSNYILLALHNAQWSKSYYE